MARPIFIARTKSSPYGVFLYNDFEAVQLGTSPTGIAENGVNSSYTNKVIQVQNDVYLLGGSVLRKYNKTTTDWDIVYHPGPNPTTKWDSGIFYLQVNGVPHLAWIYSTTNNGLNWRGVKYNLRTGVATETADGAYTSNLTKFTSILYNNSIYFFHQVVAQGNGSPLIYNPATNTIGTIAAGGAEGVSGGISQSAACIFNKQLFALVYRDATNSTVITRFNGSNFSTFATLETVAGGGGANLHGMVMFTDKTYLYVIYPRQSNANYRAWRMDSAGALTEITSSVLPSELQNNSGISNRAWVYVNSEDDPDNPEIFIYIALSNTAGTPVTKYKWNGSSALMSIAGIGGDLSFGWTDDQEGAGHRSYTLNEPDILITSTEQSLSAGAVKINFNIYESPLIPSGTQCWVRILADSDFEYPMSLCSLSNPQPSGTIVGGNTITNIAIGSGTNYSVDWRPSLDGITPNQSVKLVPWVSGII